MLIQKSLCAWQVFDWVNRVFNRGLVKRFYSKIQEAKFVSFWGCM